MMIKIEEIQELMNEARNGVAGYIQATCLQRYLPLYNRAEEIAALAISLDAECRRHDWQPIETAPKEVEFRCLLAHRYSVVTGYWDGERWVNERSASGSTFPATHWMPLPSPPASTQDDEKED